MKEYTHTHNTQRDHEQELKIGVTKRKLTFTNDSITVVLLFDSKLDFAEAVHKHKFKLAQGL